MHAEMIALRLIHVMGGIFWVGTGVFTAVFLGPAIAEAGPAGNQVMAGLMRRHLFTALPVAALLTILSGLRLMWIDSVGFSAAYFQSPSGHAFAGGGALAIVTFLFSLVLVRPGFARLGKLGQTLATAATPEERERIGTEMTALRRRTGIASMIALVLIVLAASAMAVGRYL